MQLTTIEITKPYLEFSAGHFTIFSPTHREKMHGHNFNLHADIVAEVQDIGIAFDYMIYKTKLLQMCKQLNGYFLLASQSPYFKLEEKGNSYIGAFNGETFSFPKDDVIVLPIRNVTVEELAEWFLAQLTQDKAAIEEHRIHAITLKVFSSPGQGAAASWKRI